MTFINQVNSPGWWQLVRWLFDPITFLEDCTDRFGSIFSVKLLGGNFMTIISDPAGVADLFALNPTTFESGALGKLLEPLVGLDSLLLLDGPEHRRHRKLLLPPFHGERMTAYGQLICDLTRQQTAAWQTGSVIPARQVTQAITLKTILKAVFGLVEGDRYAQIQVLTARILDSLGSPLSSSLLFLPALQQDWGAWSPWGYFLRQRAMLDALLYAEITERRAESDANLAERTDILSLLLAARDEAGAPMTDREIRDELMTMLLAGHETTATALAWALWWLSCNPEMADRVRAEVAALGEQPEPMAIARLPYLNAVCQETLRLYPVVLTGTPRRLLEPATIGDRAYPAGTILLAGIYPIHHREDLYPNSDQFRPDRFLERSFANSEFLAFGGGTRSCIGMAFAQFEMKLALATVLMDWSFTYAGGPPPRPSRRGVTMGPSGKVPLRVQRRDRASVAASAVAQSVH